MTEEWLDRLGRALVSDNTETQRRDWGTQVHNDRQNLGMKNNNNKQVWQIIKIQKKQDKHSERYSMRPTHLVVNILS